jgi:hypothetical protein
MAISSLTVLLATQLSINTTEYATNLRAICWNAPMSRQC